jgi:hypothetical protein
MGRLTHHNRTAARSRLPLSPLWRALVVLAATLAAATFLWIVVFLPARNVNRAQALTFDGVVQKKEIRAREGRYSNPRLRYILIIRKETGELVRFRVPRAVYERALVGMPVRKEAGEPWPTVGQP